MNVGTGLVVAISISGGPNGAAGVGAVLPVHPHDERVVAGDGHEPSGSHGVHATRSRPTRTACAGTTNRSRTTVPPSPRTASTTTFTLNLTDSDLPADAVAVVSMRAAPTPRLRRDEGGFTPRRAPGDDGDPRHRPRGLRRDALDHGHPERARAGVRGDSDRERASVEQFARDLRQAYSGVDGSWPIEAISSTSITFLSPQRRTPFRLQRVQWQLNGTNLQRRFVTTSDTDGDPWVWPTRDHECGLGHPGALDPQHVDRGLHGVRGRRDHGRRRCPPTSAS